MQRKANFTAGKSDDFMIHGLQLPDDTFPTAANVFVTLDTDRPVSAAQVLLAALLTPYRNDSEAASVYSDLACVARELAELADSSNVEDDYGSYLKAALAILLSAAESGAASPASLEPLTDTANVSHEDPQLTDLLTRLNEFVRDRQLGGGPLDHRETPL